MFPIGVEMSTNPVTRLSHSYGQAAVVVPNATATALRVPLDVVSLPLALPLSQSHPIDPALQRTFELQQASLKSAHALGFWIIGVILLAISASTGLLVCRSPRGTGRRVTVNGIVARTTGWGNSSTQSRGVAGLTDFKRPDTNRADLSKHVEAEKKNFDLSSGSSWPVVSSPSLSSGPSAQRSQSLSTISYEIDDLPPSYASLENVRCCTVETRNPVLQQAIIIQMPSGTSAAGSPATAADNNTSLMLSHHPHHNRGHYQQQPQQQQHFDQNLHHQFDSVQC